jgi:hypothetical protein
MIAEKPTFQLNIRIFRPKKADFLGEKSTFHTFSPKNQRPNPKIKYES